MDKNLDLVAKELFGKLRSQFSNIELKDQNGEATGKENLARNFTFDYERNGVALGSISIDISDEDGLVIIYSNDILEDQPDGVKKHWFNFLREISDFSKQKMLKFSIRDITKSNLDKRDYKFLSQKHGEAQMTESKLWGSAKTSYQDLGETKLIIKHSQPINSNLPAGRTMHIESIYIENQSGERFRYPMKHLNGARAMAEHIKHGGNPYDEIGQYIVGLSEEMNSLRKFKGYVSRTPVVSEAMGDISERVVGRIEELKKEVSNLQKSSYYESFSESFTKTESNEIPEDIVNDWVERLTIKSFNEELKNVFPYIYKLVGTDINPIKEMSYDDFVNLKNDDVSVSEQKKTLDVENAYEMFLNKIIGEGTDIFSNNEEEQNSAIEKLNQLVSQEFPVGTDGSNATESLAEIIDDKELIEVFKELADVNPNADIRNILKDYIAIKDEENGTDISAKVNFPDTGSQEPVAEPTDPAAAAPAPTDPAAAAPAPAPSMPMTPGVAMAENIKRVIERAKQAGMTAEDTFTLFGREVTLADAIQTAGLDLHEFFDNGYKDSGDEVVEFVRSMFDEEGNTPKGPTGVLISVEKKFGEEAVDKAEEVMSELMSQAEMKRIQELSGISSAQEGAVDDLAFGAGKFVGKVQKGATDAMGKLRQGVSDIASNFQSGRGAGMSDLPQGDLVGLPRGQGGQTDPKSDKSNQIFPPMRLPSDEKFPPMKLPKGDERVFPPMKLPQGQANQPASPRPNPGTMTPGVTGPGGQKPIMKPTPSSQKPQPNMNGNFKESEDLTAMLRIAGLR
jgi:hypothetical protein